MEPEVTTETTENIADVPSEGQELDLKGALEKGLNSQEGQVAAPLEPANLEEWKADGRFKSGMWKTPDDILKSYREMEKLQAPLKQELESLKGQHKELTEYKTQYSSVVDYITHLASHPEYRGKLEEFVKSIEQAEKHRQFGDLPEDVIKRIQEGQEANAKLQQLEKEKTEQAEHEKLVESFTGVLSEISTFCEENGIEWDQKAREEFVAYAKEQGKTSPQDFHVLFFKHVTPLLRAEYTQRGEKGVLKTLDTNKKSAIPAAPSGRVATQTPEQKSLRQSLENVFNK